MTQRATNGPVSHLFLYAAKGPFHRLSRPEMSHRRGEAFPYEEVI